MIDPAVLSGFPIDVYSRLQSLFFHVQDIRRRATTPIYRQFVDDYEAMAVRFVELCRVNLQEHPNLEALRLHEAVDKLTQEWYTVIELIATMELGASYLNGFQPYIDLAAQDIGLSAAGDQFILVPTFGEYFGLTRFEYSTSRLAMLKLPLSTINAPWEWSVFWHEVAGLKVEKIKAQLQAHLDNYVEKKGLTLNADGEEATLIGTLFERILTGGVVDSSLREKLKPVLKRATGGGTKGARSTARRIWSIDWLEQLFEDACSVLAFGDDFPFVFEKILGRNLSRLNGDRRHPDLPTRLKVAKRLLALKQGSVAAPSDADERLTDELLWSFIQQQTVGSEGYLPVAFEKDTDVPDLRKKLIAVMAEFGKVFGVPSPYPASLVQKVKALPEQESRTPPDSVPTLIPNQVMQTKLNELFANSELKALLEVELSQTDPFDIRWHGVDSGHQGLSINVHNQDHSIWIAWHV